MKQTLVQTRSSRVGLALSGGGFRASLFHIGVLARLAELDLLREIQVLSTVSGGSIIGALYYLHVRNLLQSKPDAEIGRCDYVAMVDRISREFTAAIANNLRMLAFADARKNRDMLGRLDYSRSDRMAELYDQFLYAPAVGPRDKRPVRLPEMTITPRGMPNFHPFARTDKRCKTNQDRVHKVPILVINATTLNTGHEFQFTATWMGEPPALQFHGDLDRNLRLRRAHYFADDLPQKYKEIPLGVAVAASAAVPGLFPPLALTDLYRDGSEPLTPQLVDGGVHDNQGIGGLLTPDHACTHLIVSDASGQMEDVANPVTNLGNVVKRSNDALMDRIREEEHAVLALLKRQRTIKQLVFLHLKNDLAQRELSTKPDGPPPAEPTDLTPYGVDPRVQQLLARMRTDLDAFSEVEAHALMADGYLMARHYIGADFTAGGAKPGEQTPAVVGPVAAEPTPQWTFLDVKPYLEKPALDPTFLPQLAAGSRHFGKTRRIVPAPDQTPLSIIRGAATFGVAIVALSVGWFASRLLLAAALALAATWGLRILARASGWRACEAWMRTIHAVVPGILSSGAVAWGVARHLSAWTPLRLKFGRMSRLVPPPAVASSNDGERDAA